jgi:uroporphyrinogen-III synthase
MHLLITRPQPQADAWVARLRERGAVADALPLIQIDAPRDSAPVQAAWQQLATQALVMFVSPNAVERFFALRPADAGWPAATLAGSTGPGTSAALRTAGVPEAQLIEPAADATQFDSEALWQRLRGLRDWDGSQVLVVRGEGGRDWLAHTLSAAGAEVGFVAAYRRGPPHWDAAQQALLQQALRQPDRHLWVFSSSEAIGHLQALAIHADWSTARCFVSHPRIGERARAAGFGCVIDGLPSLPALLAAQGACIQSPPP